MCNKYFIKEMFYLKNYLFFAPLHLRIKLFIPECKNLPVGFNTKARRRKVEQKKAPRACAQGAFLFFQINLESSLSL
jgi:hypothetical protein